MRPCLSVFCRISFLSIVFGNHLLCYGQIQVIPYMYLSAYSLSYIWVEQDHEDEVREIFYVAVPYVTNLCSARPHRRDIYYMCSYVPALHPTMRLTVVFTALAFHQRVSKSRRLYFVQYFYDPMNRKFELSISGGFDERRGRTTCS